MPPAHSILIIPRGPHRANRKRHTVAKRVAAGLALGILSTLTLYLLTQ